MDYEYPYISEKESFPKLMIKHMKRVTSPRTGPHGLAYGFFLSIVFKKLDVPLGKGVDAIRYDRLNSLPYISMIS